MAYKYKDLILNPQIMSKAHVSLRCDACDSEFLRKRSAIKKSIRKGAKSAYCSCRCARPKLKEVKCHICKVSILKRPSLLKRTKHSFCSKICQGKHRKILNDEIRKGKNKICIVCNGIFPHSGRKKYCSDKCKGVGRQDPATIRAKRADAAINRRKARKAKAVEFKGGRCCLCGYNKCNRVLQFHHIDPLSKDFNVSHYDGKWERLIKELDKCILVCGNCHTEIHEGLHTLEKILSCNCL